MPRKPQKPAAPPAADLAFLNELASNGPAVGHVDLAGRRFYFRGLTEFERSEFYEKWFLDEHGDPILERRLQSRARLCQIHLCTEAGKPLFGPTFDDEVPDCLTEGLSALLGPLTDAFIKHDRHSVKEAEGNSEPTRSDG